MIDSSLDLSFPRKFLATTAWGQEPSFYLSQTGRRLPARRRRSLLGQRDRDDTHTGGQLAILNKY